MARAAQGGAPAAAGGAQEAAGATLGAARWAVIAALLAAVAGAFTLDGGFVYDDQHAIVGSPVVQAEVDLVEAWTSRDFWGLPLGGAAKVSWRPLLPTAWRALWALGGGAPWPMRALALLLHVGATLAGFALLRRLLPLPTAGLAAAVFALHPTHADALGGLVGGADILAAACVFAALALALGPTPLRRAALAVAALVGVGAAAKESALLALPLLAIALLAARAPWRRAAAFTLALAPIAALVLAMVARAHTGADEGALDNVVATLSAGDRVVAGLAIFARAATMLALPVGLAPDHSYAVYTDDVSDLLGAAAVGALLLALALAVGLRALRRGEVAVAVLVALAAGPVLAGSNLLFVAPTELAERLLYPATLAASAAFATLPYAALARLKLPRAASAGVLVAALALWAQLAFAAQRPWHDQRALFAAAVQAEPRSWRNRHNLGDALARAGEVNAGLWHVMLATHLKRQAPRALDWRVVDALELMPEGERLLTAPAALAGEGACGLVDAFVAAAYAQSRDPQAAAAARAIFAQRYVCE